MQSPNKRPFSHPLYGSDLSTLLTLLSENGSIPAPQWGQVAVAIGSALLRWPATMLEKAITSRKLNHMPPMKAPVFIVGHWRSGTTHLCNVLSKSPRFGYVSPIAVGLPWNLLTIGKVLRPFLEQTLPSDRLIDRVPVTADAPQEDEFGMANMLPLSFLHGLYFPKHFERNFNKGVFFDDCSPDEIEAWKQTSVYYLKKISIQQQHKQLLVRNPAYTARIKMLKNMWPGAKFIHIYRNPYRIFNSMRNYYRKLFPALALQDYSHVNINSFILKTYARMMSRLLEDSYTLKPNEYIEVRFEDMENDSLGQLNRIYHQLQLKGFETAAPYFKNYLDTIRNYKKNKYQQNPENIEIIEHHWKPFIEHWGYWKKY